MKEFIKPMAAIALLSAGSVMANDSDIDARLREMERMIQQQNTQIKELKAAVSGQEYLTREEAAALIASEVDSIVDSRVEAGLAQQKDSAPLLTLGANINQLKWDNDIRLRWEYKETDDGDESSRDRFRTRVRAGFEFKSDGWSAGLGLATGSEDARSTNDTYSESSVFETGDIRLDYAFVKYTWSDLWMSAGQVKNPFETSWMTWDGDIRPVGIFVGYKHQDFFSTFGAMYMNEDSSEADGYGVYGQVGYKGKVGSVDTLVATGLMYIVPTGVDNDGEDIALGSDVDYDYLIWDILAEASIKTDSGFKFGVLGHFAMNFGAEDDASQLASVDFVPAGYSADDENMAFLVGGNIGYGKWSASYEYAHIEGDAIYAPFSDSDFGDTVGAPSVDVKGHKVGAKYKANKNLEFGVTAMFVEPIERDTDAEGTHVQVDAVWKF